MWDSNIRLELISSEIIQAIEAFCVRNDSKVFGTVISNLKKEFPSLSDQEIWQIIGLCVNVYGGKEAEKAELAITAPISFKLKARKINEVITNMIQDSQKSITLTGYSVSDYFSEMIDLIISKSQQGIYVRLYLNDYEKHKTNLKRLMDLRTKHLRVFDYQKQDDEMAALHAKTIVVDEKELLVSSANLSYHGMQGNVEMGIRLVSEDKAKQVESLLKEMVGMKVFKELRKD
ncbi:MAG: cardiolipin synthetase [Firmicutes bacterium ADurb.Bin419]|nr:MAG: cardiolipin synthetase [Firmicutes bacterium ADurb.Bin419]